MPRNADKTRTKILDAARLILAEDGFSGLGVNALAARAGIGKPLVYRYFGGLDGVAKALMDEAVISAPEKSEGGIEALVEFGRGLAGDRLSRDLLAWALAAADCPSPEVAPDEEDAADAADAEDVSVSDDAALYAVLSAGAAFLLMWRDRHESWAGVPLETPTDLARLEMAMAEAIGRRT